MSNLKIGKVIQKYGYLSVRNQSSNPKSMFKIAWTSIYQELQSLFLRVVRSKRIYTQEWE